MVVIFSRSSDVIGRSNWFPGWSPDGRWISAANETGTFLYDVTGPIPVKQAKPLPPLGINGASFLGLRWSPDGKYIAGGAIYPDGSCMPGVIVYSLESETYERITETGCVEFSGRQVWADPSWLNDGRHLLFEHNDTLYLVDRVTRNVKELWKAPGGTDAGNFVLSPDNRTIYLILGSVEADIWLARENQ